MQAAAVACPEAGNGTDSPSFRLMERILRSTAVIVSASAVTVIEIGSGTLFPVRLAIRVPAVFVAAPGIYFCISTKPLSL